MSENGKSDIICRGDEHIEGKPSRKQDLSLATYFNLFFTLIFIIASVFVVAGVNKMMRDEALAQAEEKAHLILERNLATHHYFTRQLKPKLLDTIAENESEDYFDPVWMSSTYAVREIDNHTKSYQAHGDYYYKECVINARSEENEAVGFEREFLLRLNGGEEAGPVHKVMEIDGHKYFVSMQKGETMEEACLRCHSTPEKAPAQLVARYGAERSFNRKVGDVVSAVSIRIPLDKAYAMTQDTTIKLSLLLLGVLSIVLLSQYMFARQTILVPLARIRKKSSQIAFEPDRLGEKIEPPVGKELSELANAFNNMSAKLRENTDSLEDKIFERTKELQEQQEFLRNTIDSLNHPFYVIDANDYSIRLRNSAARQDVTGIAKACYGFIHQIKEQFNEPDHISPVQEVIKTGKPVVAEHKNYNSHGDEIIVEIHAYPVFDENGKVIQVIEYFLDITENKKAEQSERMHQSELAHASRLSVMGQMATELAHEINQPLYAILANAEGSLRLSKKLGPENKRLNERIEAVILQAERAGKIVSRIRAFASKGLPETKSVQVNGIVRDAVEFMSAELKRIDIKVSCNFQKVPCIAADSIQIEQVIINLIQNGIDSIKNCGKAGGQIEIETKRVEGCVEVSVSDNGAGVDEEIIADMFEPFTTSKEKGLGMGLSISRSIIESHGGKLSYRQNAKDGVTMFFSIPEIP